MKHKEFEDLLTKIMEEEYLSNPSDTEFEDLDSKDKPFRTEWAFESITERNSRFKNRRGDA